MPSGLHLNPDQLAMICDVGMRGMDMEVRGHCSYALSSSYGALYVLSTIYV